MHTTFTRRKFLEIGFYNVIALSFKGSHILTSKFIPLCNTLQNVSKKVSSPDHLLDIHSILKQFLFASFKATWTPVLNSSKEERRNKVEAFVESPSSDLFVQLITHKCIFIQESIPD